MTVTLNYSEDGADAISRLSQQGITIPLVTSLDAPVLPADITQVGDEELMELFTRFTAYLDFISYQIALADIEEKAAEKKLDTAIAVATAQQPKGLAAVIKAAALADPKVAQLSLAHAVAYNYRKLIQTMGENLNRDISLVSRELTRRTSDGHTMVRARKFNA